MDPMQARTPSAAAQDGAQRAAGKPAMLTILLIACVATGGALVIALGIPGAAEQLLVGLLGILMGAVGYKSLDRFERNRFGPASHPLDPFLRTTVIYAICTSLLVVQILAVLVANHHGHG